MMKFQRFFGMMKFQRFFGMMKLILIPNFIWYQEQKVKVSWFYHFRNLTKLNKRKKIGFEKPFKKLE